MFLPSLHLAFEGRAHRAAVRCCCVLPNGMLLTGSLDSTVVVWRQQEQPQIDQEQREKDCLATSLDGSNAPDMGSSKGQGSSDYVGSLYSYHTVLKHHSDFVLSLAPSLSFPGQFYSGSKDRMLCRVCADTGVVQMKYQGHGGPVCSVAEKKEIVASGDWGGEARVWDRDSGQLLFVLSQHQAFAVCVCWLGDDLVTASQSKAICFWGTSRNLTRHIENAHEDIIRSLAAFPSSSSDSSGAVSSTTKNRLLSVSNDGSIKLWSTEGRLLLSKAEAHEAFIFSDDGLCCLWRVCDAEAPSISLVQQL
ncbi:ubiquitin homeostasis protein lub1, partial [Cyclospora cayetanensis]|uniref:Ubiquitin homeostasis protein lub1 n=1 Tax=Cyclospora cayetanensis TaxID=88456 RepID=A0A6P6S016_9EIME